MLNDMKVLCLKEPSEKIENWAEELDLEVSFQPVIFIRPNLNEEKVHRFIESDGSLVITSSNALKQVQPFLKKKDTTAYCVGQTAYKELAQFYSHVIMANSAKELTAKIDLEKVSALNQFVGNLSMTVIEDFARENGLAYQKELVYETQLIYPIVGNLDHYDAILFFSPSGMRSFLEHNDLPDCLIGAMGKTTSKEIPNKEVVIPEKANTHELLTIIRKEFDGRA